MPKIPRDVLPESTLALYLDPYRFIGRRCRRRGSDLLRTRLLLKPAILITGEAGAELFYDESRFERASAQPLFLQQTLFGTGGIQTTDDEEHKRRKALFMNILGPDGVRALVERTSRIWGAYLERWTRQGRIVLYPELQRVFAEAVCRWAGVPIAGRDVEERTRQLALLFDKAGSPALGQLRARRAAVRAVRWIGRCIDEYRQNSGDREAATPLQVIAGYRDSRGELLDTAIAAIEVLNLLRPTVSVSVYATFAAHALRLYPGCRAQLNSDDPEYVECFVHEVRRFYPFCPFVTARTRIDFEYNGFYVPKGVTAVLDLYGINHDPRIWAEPNRFNPERFRGRVPRLYDFVPQGGGDYLKHHRCAGEGATVLLMKLAVEFLARRMSYDVPKQNLRIAIRRVPALPRSRFVITNVRRSGAIEAGREE